MTQTKWHDLPEPTKREIYARVKERLPHLLDPHHPNYRPGDGGGYLGGTSAGKMMSMVREAKIVALQMGIELTDVPGMLNHKRLKQRWDASLGRLVDIPE